MPNTLLNLNAKPYIPKFKLYLMLKNNVNITKCNNYMLNLNAKPFIPRNKINIY